MLGKLFGSKTRVKILKLFLLHTNQKYYIRQLARDLKLQVNSVRRELENLEKFGLLISSAGVEKDNNSSSNNKVGQEKKYYQVDKDFILFEELKVLIIKAQILYEKDFVDKLKKIGKPKLFILSGFFVNDTDAPSDILIVGRFNKLKLQKIIRELEKEFNREFNYTFMDSKEFKYRKDITDVFLFEILEGKKIVVVDEKGIS